MELTGKIAGSDLHALRDMGYMPGLHEAPRLWFVALNKRMAKVFRRNGQEIELIGEIFPVEKVVIELSNRTVGRNRSHGDHTMHHKYEPHMNESRQASLAFIDELAHWLEKAAAEDVFDRLIIAAPPEVLGEIRAVLEKNVKEKVIAEIDKELTAVDEQQLEREIENISMINF